MLVSGTFRPAARVRGAAALSACQATLEFPQAGRYAVRCRLTAAARAARRLRPIIVRLQATFTPQGGTARTETRVVRLKRTRPAYTG